MFGRILHLDSEKLLAEEMKRIGPETAGLELMQAKGRFAVVKLEGINCAAANILKQEMLSKGGEVVISSQVYRLEAGASTDVLVFGTHRQFKDLSTKLRLQPLKTLTAISAELERLLNGIDIPPCTSMTIGQRVFHWGERTHLMGIINVTPDSFSGDGFADNIEAAVTQGRRFVEEGADLLDIGGESTRPGGENITVDEELRRILPVIRRLKQETTIPLSIDTSKSEVAEAALAEGAAMINDVWGLKKDPNLKNVLNEAKVPVVIMHNRYSAGKVHFREGTGSHYHDIVYEDLLADVCRDLRESIDLALSAGIAEDRILVDPGIGFGKTPEQNLHLLRRLGEIRSLGFPILLGTSRKSFIGKVLQRQPKDRLMGTAVTNVLAIVGGADMIRVHDVEAMEQVARMTDAILRS